MADSGRKDLTQIVKQKQQLSKQQREALEQDMFFSKLSNRFFGGKQVVREKWESISKRYQDLEWAKRQLVQIFEVYTEQIESFNPQLIESWKDYLYSQLEFVITQKFGYQKASTLLEINAYIFYCSFERLLSEDQSFEEYKSVLVRHCLFRPPGSINIFSKEDLDQIVSFAQSSFYRYYKMYFFAYTPSVNVEIRTHQMFKSRFPHSDSLGDAEPIQRGQIELLNEYLIDKETGLTPEQLEEIMEGNSIHAVPAKKRQEWLRQREERERKEKIEKALEKELEVLRADVDQKMQDQDEEFLQKVHDIKNPPKKK